MREALLPVIVWAAHFTAIYGFTSLACARHFAAAVPWVVGAVSAAALSALVAIAVPAGIRAARTAQFQDVVASGVCALAAIAIVWEASSLLGVRPCA